MRQTACPDRGLSVAVSELQSQSCRLSATVSALQTACSGRGVGEVSDCEQQIRLTCCVVVGRLMASRQEPSALAGGHDGVSLSGVERCRYRLASQATPASARRYGKPHISRTCDNGIRIVETAHAAIGSNRI